MRAKAEGGDAVAMRLLGVWHALRRHGLEKDEAAGYGWYKRGADLGDASCLWLAGCSLANGLGVEKDIAYGMMLVGRAAERGSAGAAFSLGTRFDAGNRGLPKDLTQAKAWYEKVASATVRDITDGDINIAADRVQELSRVLERSG
eukprot:1305781-Prymnesium_polylepis.1